MSSNNANTNTHRGRGTFRGDGGRGRGGAFPGSWQRSRGGFRGNFERGRGDFGGRGANLAARPNAVFEGQAREEARPPLAATQVENTPPVADMAALAISDPAVTPADATSEQGSVDDDLPPPSLWTGKEFKNVQEMDRAFYSYYEKRGYVKDPLTSTPLAQRPDFVPTVYSSRSGEVGTCWQTTPSSGRFGDSSHQEVVDICVHRSFEDAEEWRKKRLAEFREEIKGVSNGTSQWWDLQNQIKSYSQPMSRPRLDRRRDNEVSVPPHVDTRKTTGTVQDIRVVRGINPNVETERRFEAAIRSAQKAGIVPGKDGKWTPGTIWGPVVSVDCVDADEAVVEEEEDEKGVEVAVATSASDRTAPSTLHGFRPRYHRPNRLGLGHHGYDDVFIKQRDGVAFTSEDVPQGPWNESRDGPILFETEDGSERHVVTVKLSEDNPIYETRSPGLQKDLYTRVSENERSNKREASYQGRSHAGQQRQAAGAFITSSW